MTSLNHFSSSACRSLFISCLLACPLICQAQNLWAVYNQALQNNPQLERAREGLLAMQESKSQAQASAYLPEAVITANINRDSQNIQFGGSAIGLSGSSTFTTGGYNLSITQPLFHVDRWLALGQADARLAQVEAETNAVEIGLMLKVAERYFDTLAGEENLSFAEALEQSLKRKLIETKQRQAVGFLALTDVQEAQSGYDRAVADAIAADHLLRDTREALQEVTGFFPETLSALTEDFPLVEPEPADENSWVKLALVQNYGILAQEKAVEVAQDDIQRMRAGHLPTLDATGIQSFSTTGGRFGSADVEDTVVGLSLSLPLYQGGRVNSKTREAGHKYRQAIADLDEAKRAVHRATSKAYRGVVAGISRVNALKQALKSSETALKATLAGFNAGRRTNLDIIIAERERLAAQRDFARARYDYLLNTLRLKQAVGSLSPEDLKQIDHWLTIPNEKTPANDKDS